MAADAEPTAKGKLTKEERAARRARREAAGKPVGKRAEKPAGDVTAGGLGETAAKRAGKAGRGAAAVKRAGAGRATATSADKPAGKKVRNAVRVPRGADRGRQPNARKILVIGFQKTGTTTMTAALRALGFSVAQASQAVNLALRGDKLTPEQIDETVRRIAFEVADKADAVQDSPYPLLFKELDARYPGSKFIYLDRDPDSWVKSVVGHFGAGGNGLRDWIYGKARPKGNEEVYRRRFVDHRDEVRAYFKDRPDDILIMDLAAGDGWLKLVPFLGADFPMPFPHRNKRG